MSNFENTIDSIRSPNFFSEYGNDDFAKTEFVWLPSKNFDDEVSEGVSTAADTNPVALISPGKEVPGSALAGGFNPEIYNSLDGSIKSFLDSLPQGEHGLTIKKGAGDGLPPGSIYEGIPPEEQNVLDPVLPGSSGESEGSGGARGGFPPTNYTEGGKGVDSLILESSVSDPVFFV
jgi:hypothetical protein